MMFSSELSEECHLSFFCFSALFFNKEENKPNNNNKHKPPTNKTKQQTQTDKKTPRQTTNTFRDYLAQDRSLLRTQGSCSKDQLKLNLIFWEWVGKARVACQLECAENKKP